EPIGHLIVRRLQSAHAGAFRIELAEKPVALVRQESHLLQERRHRSALPAFCENLSQEILKCVDRGVEACRCLLQSVRLSHLDLLPPYRITHQNSGATYPASLPRRR